MTVQTNVISAFAAGRTADATALVFEYMAATLAETGRAVPNGIGELPAILQRECRDLPSVYHLPGALFIADHGTPAVACVGVAPSAHEGTAEVKRLYVRPAYRGNGIAHTLITHAHHHARTRPHPARARRPASPQDRHQLLPQPRIHRNRTLPHRSTRPHGPHAALRHA